MKVERYSPRVYTVILNSMNQTGSGPSGYNFNVKMEFVDNTKQYYIRCSRAFIQDIVSNNAEERALVMRSRSIILNNTYDTKRGSYTDILGTFEIQHSGTSHWVAYNEVGNMHNVSGLFLNGSLLQNGFINIYFENLAGVELAINGGDYGQFLIELTLVEVD